MPPKLTAVAPVKLAPVMVTVVPVPADVGKNDEMVGAALKAENTTQLNTSVKNNSFFPIG